MKLGEKISALLEKRDRSVRDLACLWTCTDRYVYMVLKGQKCPTLEKILLCAWYLDDPLLPCDDIEIITTARFKEKR